MTGSIGQEGAEWPTYKIVDQGRGCGMLPWANGGCLQVSVNNNIKEQYFLM